MISRNNRCIKNIFEEYISLNKENEEAGLDFEDIKYSSIEDLFDDIDNFIIEVSKIKSKKNTPPKPIQTLINMFEAIDPSDHNIYSEGGWQGSLVTGDYDEPSDGHTPIFLANYFEIKNEKINKSIYLIEIKDNSGGAYYRPDEKERIIIYDYFFSFEDAQSSIDKYFKEATG